MSTHVERVVLFGTSHTLGLGTADRRGWAQMLQGHFNDLNAATLDEQLREPRIFYQLGVFAMRAQELDDMIEPTIKPRLWLSSENTNDYDPTKRLAVVEVGTNDSWILTNGNRLVSPNGFREKVTSIAAKLAVKSRILYIGTLPPDVEKDSAFLGVPAAPDQLAARIEYEQIAAQVFEQAGGQAVRLAAAAAESPDFMGSIAHDGVHLGKNGEQWVYNQVVPHFDAMMY